MSPLLIALAGVSCYLVGWRGIRLVRSGVAVPYFVQENEATEKPVPTSMLDRLLGFLAARLSQPMLEVMGTRRVERLERRLALAGYPDGMNVHTFAGRKGAWTLMMGIPGALFLSLGRPLPGLVLALIGWFMMDLGLRREAKQRQGQIAIDLPDFLDIVSVTITAGSSFRGAMQRVADELPGPLSDEVLTALRQMELGASRRSAFEGLRERTDVDTLNSFITALLQAEELGTPLADTLTELSRDMRTERMQRMRKKAAEAAPKISLVVIIIMVPATLIIAVAGMFMGSEFSFDVFSTEGS